eukprot:m.80736 g.80736  ORF g.80736 m.80736 type:complete len:361 (-) comp20937_c0_seq1:44-1126(-)
MGLRLVQACPCFLSSTTTVTALTLRKPCSPIPATFFLQAHTFRAYPPSFPPPPPPTPNDVFLNQPVHSQRNNFHVHELYSSKLPTSSQQRPTFTSEVSSSQPHAIARKYFFRPPPAPSFKAQALPESTVSNSLIFRDGHRRSSSWPSPLIPQPSLSCQSSSSPSALPPTTTTTTTTGANTKTTPKTPSHSQQQGKENEKEMENKRKRQEQLTTILFKLREELPRCFKSPLDFSFYDPGMTFEDKVSGLRLETLTQYRVAVNSTISCLKMYAKHPQLDLLWISRLPDKHAVHCRWRLSCVSRLSLPQAFGIPSWVDGYSLFYVNDQGLIQHHVIDNRVPVSEDPAALEDEIHKTPSATSTG